MADTKKEAIYYGTGRRKNAIARVRLVPGTGKVTVNKRDAEDYFGRKALVEFATAPFTVTGTAKHFDVIATLNGGGISGQAGAPAPRHRPRSARGWRLPRRAQEGRLPHARSAYGRAQEVRSQEGPQASAVLQALSFERYICKKKARICGPSSCLPTALSPAVPAPHRLHRVRQPLPRGSNLP